MISSFSMPGHRQKSQRGFLGVELVVAISILAIAILPLAFTLVRDQELFRAYQVQAAILEVLDGELEVLAAGYVNDFPNGVHSYTPAAESMRYMPAGTMTLLRSNRLLRLEWKPDKSWRGGILVKQIHITP